MSTTHASILASENSMNCNVHGVTNRQTKLATFTINYSESHKSIMSTRVGLGEEKMQPERAPASATRAAPAPNPGTRDELHWPAPPAAAEVDGWALGTSQVGKEKVVLEEVTGLQGSSEQGGSEPLGEGAPRDAFDGAATPAGCRGDGVGKCVVLGMLEYARCQSHHRISGDLL